MDDHCWMKEFPGGMMVCNQEGTILEMNDRSARNYASDGGYALVGKNALECHPEPARSKLKAMLEAGKPNIYTIEKNGIKKLIYQSPWYQNGQYAGFVELSLEVPFEMEHFVRS